MNAEQARVLKDDLFKVIQYCHDNDKEFFERFCSIDFKILESINSIFMSGSSSIMLITCWYHDELIDKTIPIRTQDLLEWVVKHSCESHQTKQGNE